MIVTVSLWISVNYTGPENRTFPLIFLKVVVWAERVDLKHPGFGSEAAHSKSYFTTKKM